MDAGKIDKSEYRLLLIKAINVGLVSVVKYLIECGTKCDNSPLTTVLSSYNPDVSMVMYLCEVIEVITVDNIKDALGHFDWIAEHVITHPKSSHVYSRGNWLLIQCDNTRMINFILSYPDIIFTDLETPLISFIKRAPH
jgi:hypothetical protein